MLVQAERRMLVDGLLGGWKLLQRRMALRAAHTQGWRCGALYLTGRSGRDRVVLTLGYFLAENERQDGDYGMKGRKVNFA